MEIYIIRHIEPDIEKGICYGQTDVPIPFNYKDTQAAIIKDLPTDFEAVYSSPLTRCKIFAEQISEKVRFDDRLKELNFGDWEGIKWDDIDKMELSRWMENYIEMAPPQGESLIELLKRFSAFIEEIKKKKYKKVLLVTHAGIARAAMHLFNHIPLDRVMMEKINFGGTNIYSLS